MGKPRINKSNLLPIKGEPHCHNYEAQSFRAGFRRGRKQKSLWKSRNFWAAIALFVLSLLTALTNFPGLYDNPTITGVIGMLFAIAWIVLRMSSSDDEVYPTVNIPNPSDWKWRRKK